MTCVRENLSFLPSMQLCVSIVEQCLYLYRDARFHSTLLFSPLSRSPVTHSIRNHPSGQVMNEVSNATPDLLERSRRIRMSSDCHCSAMMLTSPPSMQTNHIFVADLISSTAFSHGRLLQRQHDLRPREIRASSRTESEVVIRTRR